MGRATENIVRVAAAFVSQLGGSLSSGSESRLKAIGRALDAGSMTSDQAADKVEREINDRASKNMSRDDLKKLRKDLDKLTH
ncbi:MAG: hypothetical protein PHT88_00150 [Candidatus Moranbacteria bacterium]|nr:hypothetical protein [Candidatus Moranbacteria bacterium]